MFFGLTVLPNKSNCFSLNLVLSLDPVIHLTLKGNDKMSKGKVIRRRGGDGNKVEEMTFGLQQPATVGAPGSPRKSISRLGRTPKMLLFHSCF